MDRVPAFVSGFVLPRGVTVADFCVEFWHGSVDATILPPNYNETLKQWTNVFGVSTTPTRSRANTPQTNYRTDDFGSNVQGIWAVGVGHGVPAHQAQTEAWFGL